MESREISDVSTTADFGETVTYTIARDTADLIHKMYFETILPDPAGTIVYCPYPGEKLLKKMSLHIGGVAIETHYSDWLHIWNELSLGTDQKLTYEKMVGHRNSMVIDGSGGLISVPLQFWFCRNAGLALPRKALDRTTVSIIIEFEKATKMGRSKNDPAGMGGEGVGGTLTNPKLYGDYIYLDSDESRRFLASRHEYLIEQVQVAPGIEGASINSSGTTTLRLNFTHSVKELIWITKNDDLSSTVDGSGNGINDHFNYSRGMGFDGSGNLYSALKFHATAENIVGNLTYNDDPMTQAKIQFNGEDRISAGNRKAQYFNLVQPYYHHTGHPSPGVYVYSFALRPEEYQPSGSVNMSRIDDQKLTMSFNGSSQDKLIAFGLNYNILVITDGLANLVWS